MRLDYQIARKQLDDTKEQIKLQTTLAWNELQAAKFSWKSAEKNVLAAESIYRIVNNKYRAGQGACWSSWKPKHGGPMRT
ncbi:MAG: TolC family protein [Saprospiraceae bacterium]